MFSRFKTSLRTIALVVSLGCLALLSKGGVFASELLSKFEAADIAGLKEKLMPLGVNLLTGLLFLSIAYLFYRPVKTALVKALDSAGASARGKTLLLRSVQLSYWAFVIFVFGCRGS